MSTYLMLILAAAMEVGGDALIRAGLKGSGILAMIAGAVVLIAYGFAVNLTKLDFGKLMGLYIVIFFLVSQGVAWAFFHESPRLPLLIGGSMVVAGGITMAVWQ